MTDVLVGSLQVQTTPTAREPEPRRCSTAVPAASVGNPATEARPHLLKLVAFVAAIFAFGVTGTVAKAFRQGALATPKAIVSVAPTLP